MWYNGKMVASYFSSTIFMQVWFINNSYHVSSWYWFILHLHHCVHWSVSLAHPTSSLTPFLVLYQLYRALLVGLWTLGVKLTQGIEQIPRHAGCSPSSFSFPTCCSAPPESALSTGIALILSRLQCNNTHCLISVWWMKSFNETGPNCSGKLPYFCVLNGSDPSAAACTLSLSLQPSLQALITEISAIPALTVLLVLSAWLVGCCWSFLPAHLMPYCCWCTWWVAISPALCTDLPLHSPWVQNPGMLTGRMPGGY